MPRQDNAKTRQCQDNAKKPNAGAATRRRQLFFSRAYGPARRRQLFFSRPTARRGAGGYFFRAYGGSPPVVILFPVLAGARRRILFWPTARRARRSFSSTAARRHYFFPGLRRARRRPLCLSGHGRRGGQLFFSGPTARRGAGGHSFFRARLVLALVPVADVRPGVGAGGSAGSGAGVGLLACVRAAQAPLLGEQGAGARGVRAGALARGVDGEEAAAFAGWCRLAWPWGCAVGKAEPEPE